MGAGGMLRPIRDEHGYREAVAEIRALWGAEEGSPARDRLEVLMVLASAYEEDAHPLGLPDPVGAIESSMEEKGVSAADLARLLGVGEAQVAAILERRQRPTLEMIRPLSEALTISIETLVQDYRLVESPRMGETATPDAAGQPRHRSPAAIAG